MKPMPLFICLLVVLQSSSLYAATKPVVDAAALVNGVAIPNTLIQRSVELNVQQGKKDTPELRQLIKEEFINREILAQQAAKLGLDKTPESKAAMAEIKRNFMVDLFLNDYDKKHPISEAALKTEYERQVAALGNQTHEYRLSHIVTKTEEEAKTLIAKIKKGESFAKVAREFSIDASAKEGGLLAWVLPSQIVPAVSNVIVTLSEGGMTQSPIETSAGWQIVRVEEKRPFKAPEFKDVLPQLRGGLLQQQRLEAIKKLRESAKVTINK
jgi:peptidyl-prolyl cis-trans isomerase C